MPAMCFRRYQHKKRRIAPDYPGLFLKKPIVLKKGVVMNLWG